MKFQLSHSYDNLSLLEPAWILLAFFAFSLGPTQSGLIAAGLVFLVCPFLQRWAMTGCPSRPTKFDGPWALFLAGAIVSLGVSYDVSLSLPVFLVLAGSIALYYAVANTPKSIALAYVALLAGLVVAVCFLVQYQYILDSSKSDLALLLGDFSKLFPRLESWSLFPNSVATLLEGLIPPGIALTLSSRSLGGRVVAGIATSLIGLAVVAAASRGAWVALLAAGALWLVSRLRRGPIGLVVAVLVTFAVVGGYLTLIKGATLTGVPVVGPPLYDLFARPDRLEVYQGSLRLIQDYPLTGIGVGQVFALVYSRYVLLIPHVFLTYSHNLYLTIWLGHGLLGVIGMGWLVVAFGCFVVRESRQGHPPSPLFQAAWTGAVVILIHGLFDARQYVDLWTMWPLFVLLGLVVSTGMVRAEKKVWPAMLSQQWKWIVLALLAVVCIVGYRPLAAAACANFGAVKQAKAELGHLPDVSQKAHLQAATVNYDRALRLDPASRTARLRLGNLAVAAGRYEEGISHLEVVWQDDPKDPTVCKALGLAYVWVDEIDRAVELLQNSRNIVAELNAWGGWHRSQGRQRVAMSAYRTSLALEPDQPQVRDLLSTMESR